MHQFWYTITYDLTAQAYFFTMGDQDFEVNANVLCNALSIKVLDHPFALPAPEKKIIKFINELGCPKPIKTIYALRVNDLYQPWRTFLPMINKCLTRKATTYDRPRLPMLQLLNNRPNFGMAILAVMLNDNIKAFAEYTEYLTKARESKHVVKGGKGLLFKKGVEIDVERINEELLIRRQTTGIKGASEERVDHSMKLKGLETLFEATQLKVHLKKVQKANKDYFFIQQRSKGSVEDISSDEAKVTKKADNTKIAYAEKDTKDQVDDEQVVEKQARGEEHCANQGGNEPAGDAQAHVQISKAQLQKPKATLISSSQTLSSIEFTNKFNKPAEVNLSNILKDPIEPEVQLMVDVLVKQAKPATLRPPLVDTTMTLIPNITRGSPTQPPPTQPKRIKIKRILKKSQNPKS
uniref:Uncharacterized protein n=1 Tax=Tanacetum cinerariifolium TaxID=118510 RepID=A0A699HTE3_TANCI|nr:hypothetical protein [Tanacetum cinerariifolium]